MKQFLVFFLLSLSAVGGAQVIKTDTQLQAQADSIKNETRAGANTAIRIGQMYKDIITAKINKKDSTVAFVTPTQAEDLYVKRQSQNPTAIINPALSYERRPAGFFTQSFDWTIGREARTANNKATDSILTVNVDGFNRAFTQPAAGASFTGSTDVNITWNVNKRVNVIVTTKDNKTATAFADVNVYDKRYIGWSVTTTPTDAEIRAAINQDNSGGTVSYSATLAQLGTSRYLFYANTVNINSVSVNGFPSSDAFNLNVSRSFTNAVGGTTTYFVTTSKNAIGATSSTSLTIN